MPVAPVAPRDPTAPVAPTSFTKIKHNNSIKTIQYNLLDLMHRNLTQAANNNVLE